jgi:hypothetical protein
LFEYLETCFPEQGWDLEARRHLEIAARSLETCPWLGAPLFGQFSGVAFAAWYLSRQGRRYRELSRALDQALFPKIDEMAEALDSTSEGCPVHLFDLISGITGAGIYLLCRADRDDARMALGRVLRSLVSLTVEDGGLPRWRTPRHLLGEEQAKLYPDGNLNCGLAHGIPGPLALMSLAKRRGIRVPGLEEGIERIVAWLWAHRVEDQRGVSWPAFCSLSRPGERPVEPEGGIPDKTAWCYGSPGVSRAVYLAGQALARPEWCKIAIDAMRAAVSRPVAEQRLPSPTFCHGVAGLLQITHRFFLDTGLRDFQRASQYQLAQLIAAHEPESILGFRSLEPLGRRVDNPGLLDGTQGVCLAMLAATMPAEPTWDRFLLLS